MQGSHNLHPTHKKLREKKNISHLARVGALSAASNALGLFHALFRECPLIARATFRIRLVMVVVVVVVMVRSGKAGSNVFLRSQIVSS
jgi:hypothetical protein